MKTLLGTVALALAFAAPAAEARTVKHASGHQTAAKAASSKKKPATHKKKAAKKKARHRAASHAA